MSIILDFMQKAKEYSWLSPDIKRKVGCIITDEDDMEAGSGYNQAPSTAVSLTEVDWNSDEKHQFIVHAEIAALLESGYQRNGKLYCTLSPCRNCAKAIALAGIRTVYYRDLHSTTGSDGLAALEEFGVTVEQVIE